MARRYRDAMPPRPPAAGGYSYESVRVAPIGCTSPRLAPKTVGALTPAGDGDGLPPRPAPARPHRPEADGTRRATARIDRQLLRALDKLGYSHADAELALNRGDTLFRVAVTEYAQGQAEEAMAGLENSVLHAVKVDDATAAFWSLNVHGRIGLQAHRVDRVLGFAKQATSSAQETSPELSAVALINYGALLSRADHRDDARAAYRDALEVLMRSTR